MKRRNYLLAVLLTVLCFAGVARGDYVSDLLTITNVPADGNTITINGTVRTWKTTVTVAATQIQATNTIAASATNLLNQIQLSPLVQVTVVTNGANNGVILGGLSLTVATSAGWATNVFTTNAGSGSALILPITGLSVPNRTNLATLALQAIDVYSQASFDSNDVAMAEFDSLGNAQTITGAKQFSSISGVVGNLTNGTWTNPNFTNAVNKGNAFSSPGVGINGEQFGSGATATGNSTLAIGAGATTGSANGATAIGASAVASASSATSLGSGALATGVNSIAISVASSASGVNSLAMGKLSTSSGTNSTAFGTGASASGANSMAFGEVSSCTADNSFAIGVGAVENAINAIAIGNNVTNNTANEITMGSASQTVRAAGNLAVSGNAFIAGNLTNLTTASGTNVFNGSVATPRYNNTAMANGANQDVSAGTNVYVKLSGNTAAFSVAGIANPSDGREVVLQNSTGFNMTISNDSGSETTPANRIYTGTGADVVLTCAAVANPVNARLIYDSGAARWILISHNP